MTGKFTIFILLTFIICSCNSYTKDKSKQEDLPETIAIGDTCKVIDNYLTKLEKEKNFSGALLIIKDGKKIFSKGYGFANKEEKIPFTPSTLVSMGSITKVFTATAIMKLYENGKIRLDDKLIKYFPETPEDKANITIHQLLTHSSGFHELENDNGDYEKVNTEEYLKRVFTAPLSFEPGTKAIYTNVNFSILAIIIEKITGMDYEKFLTENVLAPIGIKHINYQYPVEKGVVIAHGYQNGKDWGTHQSHFDKAGGGPYWNLKGNGGLEASLDEMFLWANAFTNHTVLHDTTVKRMFTEHVIEDGTDGHYSFGYGCNLSTTPRNTIEIDNGGSNGIYFARLSRLPQEGLVFYMVTNESSVGTDKVMPNIRQLYFLGKIEQDALGEGNFNHPKAQLVYNLLIEKGASDFEKNIKASGIEIQDDMILFEVGETLMKQSKTDEALALYQYYTKSFPNIVVAWNNLGDIYLSKSNKQEAKQCYEQALKIRPGNPRAQQSLEKLKS